MELKKLMETRRSVRSFTDAPVPESVLEELLRAAMSAPSACDRRPWHFYVVTDSEKLKALRSATHFSNINAPAAIVVCGDTARALPNPMTDYWIQDCSAASQNILLRAADMGLGAVWCGVYPQVRPVRVISQILDLPEDRIPLNILYTGTPAQIPEPHDRFEKACITRI